MASKLNKIDSISKFLNLYRPWVFKNKQTKNDTSSKYLLKKNQLDFTFCTFNILSEDYLKSYNDHLYSFCPPNVLKFSERGLRILDEIKLNNPDILCLQEVFLDHYTNFYSPELKKQGYEALFSLRDSRFDGCALFFKTNKFNLLKSKEVDLHREDLNKVLNCSNVGLFAVLEPTENQAKKIDNHLVIGTTHIVFNPRKGEIKLAQLRLLLAELERLAFREIDENGNKTYYPFILGGDFNLLPNSELHKFIEKGNFDWRDQETITLSGHISKKFKSKNKKYLDEESVNIKTISSSTEFINENEEIINRQSNDDQQQPEEDNNNNNQVDNNQIITHNLKLKSVFKSTNNYNQNLITTTHDRACEMVDYIFYNRTNELDLIGFRKLISENIANKEIPYLPNEYIGSDHFSLIAKFSLYNKKK